MVNFNIAFCQINAKKEILNYFDKNIGEEVLNVNNGPAHTDPYNLYKDNHNYFGFNKYDLVIVFFDKQLYENVPLKYDIYKDQLVKSFEKSDSEAITIISQKVDYFIISNKRFVNIANKYNDQKEVSGFLEEIYVGNKIATYIKHSKTAKDFIVESKLYTKFEESTDYKIFYKSKFSSINSQKQTILLFPEFKTEIKDFYLKNKFQGNNNQDQFIADLSQYIESLL